MLKHAHSSFKAPGRVLILGASGFVGQTLAPVLKAEGIETLTPTSSEVDLAGANGAHALASLMEPGDSVVMLAALTPDRGRGLATFMRNLRMVENLCQACKDVAPEHLVYFSSDAVYPMSFPLVAETTPAAPNDLYGTMHLAREVMLSDALADRLCVLRPTLIYGVEDTHNSYGPNRFRRQAAKDGRIVLGGGGEETRDHIYIGDVVALTRLVLGHGSTGRLNLATGRSVDFFSLAEKVAALFEPAPEVCTTERRVPVSHRAFDVAACHRAFPNFVFTPLERGLALVHQSVQ